MSDNAEEKKRPNANYKLSKTNDNPKEITYHYSRDRRLEKAPQSVQDLYYKEEQPRRGLLKIASGGKVQLFTMIAILLVSVLALVVTILGREGDTYDLEGNRITVQAIRYEEMVIMALRKTIPSRRQFLSLRPVRPPYMGIVSIEVLPVSAPLEYTPLFGNMFFHRVTFTEESPEFFRFTVPFDSDELELVLRTENKDLYVRVMVE